MNDTNNSERNEQMVRLMAVVGFVVLVCLLAWLAIQAVRFIPSAFSSLASIFEANQRDYDEQVDENDDNDVIVVEDDSDTDVDTSTDSDDEDTEVVATSPPVKPVVTTPKPTPTTIQYKTVTTYKVPVSDPNGKTDLSVSFLSFGYINNSGRFVAEKEISDNTEGAAQFVVKNLGTKTSTDWTFSFELENGQEIESKVQAPLKPSESSTLTVVFGEVSDNGTYDVDIAVLTKNDVNPGNNGLRTTLRVK